MQVLDEAKVNANMNLPNYVPEVNNSYVIAKRASENLVKQSSLLAEIGDGSELILKDAFEDGSSLICTRCSGLVARERWTVHCTFWCPAIESTEDCD